MKKLLILSTITISTFMFTSCRQCETCCCPNVPCWKVCDDTFETDAKYLEYLEEREEAGCDCY